MTTAATGAQRLEALVTEITTMNELARKAILVIDEEFNALEKVYAATTTTVPYHLPTHDDDNHKKPQDPLCVIVGEAMESSSPSERLVPGLAADDGHTGTGTGTVEEAGNYVQVVVDCDSLKWNLEVNRRGYMSGSTLIHDLSDVIDHHLSPPSPPAAPSDLSMYHGGADDTTTVLRSSSSSVSARRDSWDDGDDNSTINDRRDRPAGFVADAATDSSKRTYQTATSTTKKRFVFLIDPQRMMEKNYPLKKDKARLFLAGLDDSEGCELVHVGFGKKSIEERLRGINQCTHVFLAVGITSNAYHEVLNMSRPTLLELAQHPSAMEKLTVMRSGGPFDRSTGIDCLAVDRFLSVQTQQQHQPASSSSRTGGGAGGDQRERSSRSFAPSPQVTSHKTSLLTSGEEDGRGVARLQANVPRSTRSSTTTNIAPFDNEHESTRLRDATVARPCLANSWSGASTSTVTAPFDADYGSTRLLCSPSSKSVSSRGAISVHKVGVDLDEDDDDDDDDARTDMADVVAKENWPASPRASSAGEAEGYRTTPTPFSRMNTRSVTEVLYEFDARAILRKYGKPLCAKYHLNNGNCHCETLDKAIHDDIILKGSASKQLALWASDRVCPEGANCPEGLNRTCCFWRHEMRSSGGSVDSATDESDEWIAVDKKGKPIVSKPHIAVPHVWQPSKSCIEAGKLARADFNPLMTIIRQFTRDRHMPKHERGLIGTELKRAYGHDIYRRLGLAGFKEYTSRAEKAGLVRMGYQGPSAGWIAAA